MAGLTGGRVHGGGVRVQPAELGSCSCGLRHLAGCNTRQCYSVMSLAARRALPGMLRLGTNPGVRLTRGVTQGGGLPRSWEYPGVTQEGGLPRG
jgi:hypothetical protein